MSDRFGLRGITFSSPFREEEDDNANRFGLRGVNFDFNPTNRLYPQVSRAVLIFQIRRVPLFRDYVVTQR